MDQIKLNYSADEILKIANIIHKDIKSELDQLSQLKDPDPLGLLHKLSDVEQRAGILSNNCTFPCFVSVDQSVRDASIKATEILAKANEELWDNKLYYDMLKSLNVKKLDFPWNLYLDNKLKSFKFHYKNTNYNKSDQIKELKNIKGNLENEFQRCLNENSTVLLFTKAELHGMDNNFIEGLETENDMYKIHLIPSECLPIMKNCTIEETRKKINLADASKCPDNVGRLREILKIRQKIAKLKDYRNHAESIIKHTSMDSPESIIKFLNKLEDKLKPHAQAQLEQLLKIKKNYCDKIDIPFDGKIHQYDYNFYTTLLAKSYGFDEEKIKEYFPLNQVIDGMFKIYGKILSIRFEETESLEGYDYPTYKVFDFESGNILGMFILDLHPRDGKYNHAAVFTLKPRHIYSDGTISLPVCVMVTNFSNGIALLRHNELVTFFHEFGHVMHVVCSESPIGSFSGTSVEKDFVEAPSQMFENWCWEEVPISLMSGHYQTGEKLPPEVEIQKSKNINSALIQLRQIFFAKFDYFIHTSKDDVDPEEVWAKLRLPVTLIDHIPGTNPTASFLHAVGGYDARYYSYPRCLLISSNLFYQFRENLFDKSIGMKFRKKILAFSGYFNTDELIQQFTGKDQLDLDILLKNLGLI